MAGDPGAGGTASPIPDVPAMPLDTHVTEVGAPLDLASGTVEALLAQAPVAGAVASERIMTMHPWNLPRPDDEDVDGVEETAGP